MNRTLEDEYLWKINKLQTLRFISPYIFFNVLQLSFCALQVVSMLGSVAVYIHYTRGLLLVKSLKQVYFYFPSAGMNCFVLCLEQNNKNKLLISTFSDDNSVIVHVWFISIFWKYHFITEINWHLFIFTRCFCQHDDENVILAKQN